MLNVLSSVTQNGLDLQGVLLCSLASLILGIGIAAIYMFRSSYTKSFVMTLVILPAVVQSVIMLVNGNLGAGVAVAGTFSLVRFRSVAGSAREIGSIFLAMAIGLATGMGYVGFAVLFFVILGAAMFLLSVTSFGTPKTTEKELKITIPESLDYEGLFDDLFTKYTSGHELTKVRTTNMGSLYELDFHIRLKTPVIQKEFLDEIRCRNGNLNIICGRVSSIREEL